MADINELDYLYYIEFNFRVERILKDVANDLIEHGNCFVDYEDASKIAKQFKAIVSTYNKCQRVDYQDRYYCINTDMSVMKDYDTRMPVDEIAYNVGNYFTDKNVAKEVLKKFKKCLADYKNNKKPELAVKRWRAEFGDEYWTIVAGRVVKSIESMTDEDTDRYNFGLYFKTEENAKFAAARIKEALTSF